MGVHKARRGERGVALVEALASLVVVGMIGLMIIEGVGEGRRAGGRIDARASAAEAVEAAQASLRGRIEQVYPATLYEVTPENVDFSGGRDRLAFISSPPQAERPSPLRRYALQVDRAGDLVLASVSEVDPEVKSAAARQVLLSGVQALDLAYFGAATPDQVRRWRPSWDQQALPPELVRVRVLFKPGDRRAWPDLVVRPRVTIDAGCNFDAVAHRCRGRA